MDCITGTAVLELPCRDIVAGRRHIAGLSPSLPTAPPPMARTPARKAAPLDLDALLPMRDGLSAGGRRIRTRGPALIRPLQTRHRAPRGSAGERRCLVTPRCLAGLTLTLLFDPFS